MIEGVACSMIGAADLDGVVALMERIGVHFGGSRSHRVLAAVARDGIDHPDEVLVARAIVDGTPRALVIAFTERSRYWRHFVRRHPRAAFDLARHRLLRRFRRHGAPDPQVGSRIAEAGALVADRLSPPGAERWEDESPMIAKVMYVAVDPGQRKGGLGAVMYGWFFRHLRERGFTRCDAHVSSDNVAAIGLHRRFPFHFIEVRGGYFLWLLPSEIERP